MVNNELNTETKILEAANSIFMLYGYHGTTLQQIAVKANVHKSAIHYYFRSKEKLYSKVIKLLFDNILKTASKIIANLEIIGKQKWFLYTELFNNQNCFERTLKESYLNDWDKKLNEIRRLFNI